MNKKEKQTFEVAVAVGCGGAGIFVIPTLISTRDSLVSAAGVILLIAWIVWITKVATSLIKDESK